MNSFAPVSEFTPRVFPQHSFPSSTSVFCVVLNLLAVENRNFIVKVVGKIKLIIW